MHKLIFASLAIGSVVVASSVQAQAVSVTSEGEASSALTCFYECKPFSNNKFWHQATSLKLTNQGYMPVWANLTVMNGNAEFLATTQVNLSALDMDEINICRTLMAAGKPVPAAGLTEVFATTDQGGTHSAAGVYAQAKNVIGKFSITSNEFPQNLITGTSISECRNLPSTVRSAVPTQTPLIDPILIESTAE